MPSRTDGSFRPTSRRNGRGGFGRLGGCKVRPYRVCARVCRLPIFYYYAKVVLRGDGILEAGGARLPRAVLFAQRTAAVILQAQHGNKIPGQRLHKHVEGVPRLEARNGIKPLWRSGRQRAVDFLHGRVDARSLFVQHGDFRAAVFYGRIVQDLGCVEADDQLIGAGCLMDQRSQRQKEIVAVFGHFITKSGCCTGAIVVIAGQEVGGQDFAQREHGILTGGRPCVQIGAHFRQRFGRDRPRPGEQQQWVQVTGGVTHTRVEPVALPQARQQIVHALTGKDLAGLNLDLRLRVRLLLGHCGQRSQDKYQNQ